MKKKFNNRTSIKVYMDQKDRTKIRQFARQEGISESEAAWLLLKMQMIQIKATAKLF